MKKAELTRKDTAAHDQPATPTPHTCRDDFALLFEYSFDAVMLCDAAGIVLKANPAFLQVSGYAAGDILGRQAAEVLLPGPGSYAGPTGTTVEIGPKLCEELQRVFSKPPERDCASAWQGWLIKKDRSAVYIDLRRAADHGSGGATAGSLCIIRDISEKEAMQDALRKSEERFRTFFEYAPDAIYISDINGMFIDGNRIAEQLTGYSREELIGRNYFDLDLLSADQFPRALALLEQNIAGSATGPDEFELKRKDEQLVTVEICTYPLYLQGERCVLGVAHDITGRKRAEAALKKARESLEIKVQERTQDLEEANTALRVLLKGRDEDRAALEESMLHNLHELVLPCIEKLRAGELHDRQRAVLDLLETNLRDITAPMMRALTVQHLHFTPAEIAVAACIRHGKKTREIAELLQISIKTIQFHRENIRRKCGLKNKKVNLRTFLSSLA